MPRCAPLRRAVQAPLPQSAFPLSNGENRHKHFHHARILSMHLIFRLFCARWNQPATLFENRTRNMPLVQFCVNRTFRGIPALRCLANGPIFHISHLPVQHEALSKDCVHAPQLHEPSNNLHSLCALISAHSIKAGTFLLRHRLLPMPIALCSSAAP